MEKVAIPKWGERISPVLDTATKLIVLEFNDGQEIKREIINIPEEHFIERARYLAGLRIDTILCGALSRPLRQLLVQRGITVLPWITGTIKDVVKAYLQNNLANECFFLPGRNRRRRKRGFRGKRCNGFRRLEDNDSYQEES
jgi:predicted Fe-Mo cluster-binding NifX family protein